MKPEQQRIAIAEACGWELKTRRAIGYGGETNAIQYYWSKNECVGELPDYLNDFNAMHEAEQTLWQKDWASRHDFVDKLARILSPTHGHHQQSGLDLLDATAAERAEAFLRTINKWEETKL